jgi:hypothetical protein
MLTPHSKPVTSAIAGPRQQGYPDSRRAAVLQDCTRSQTRPAREPTHHETQQPPREIAETKWSEDRPCTHKGHRETARMGVGFFDANGLLDKTMSTTVRKSRAGHNARRSPRTAIIPRGWGGAGKGGNASSRSARISGTVPLPRGPTGGTASPPSVRKGSPRGPRRTCRASQSENILSSSDRLGRDRVLTVRKNIGHSGLCPSHEVPTGETASPPPVRKADPGVRAEPAGRANRRIPSRPPTGWEGPCPRGPQEYRAQCPSHEIPREGRVPAVRKERQTPGPAPNLQGEPIGEYPCELRQVERDRVLAVRKITGHRGLCPSQDPTGGVAAGRGLRVPPPLADPDPTLDFGPPT